MSETPDRRDRDRGVGLPVLQLPDAQDLDHLERLAEQMPSADPVQRAREAAKRGLLKDLAASFLPDLAAEPRRWSNRRVADLAVAVERFQAAAAALGFRPDQPQLSGDLQLRLRDSRIDRCDLSSVSIHWPVRLERCVWPQPAVFIGTAFLAPVSFLGSAFFSDANFFGATFHSDAFFGGVSFDQAADFRGATFAGEVNLFNANFRESLELRYAIFEDQSVLNVQELRFRGSTALGGGLHLHLGQIRTGRWPRYRGRLWGENAGDRRDLAVACEQYGELEANAAAQGSPDAAALRDWCHYRYMDLARRAHLPRYSLLRLLNWLFMKWCFGYGLFTKRIIITGLLVILLYGLAYLSNGFGLPAEVWTVQDNSSPPCDLARYGPWYVRVGNALYFSAVTFSTIGYGDWHPENWAKIAGATEGLLGVFIMAVFTVSFSRKMLR